MSAAAIMAFLLAAGVCSDANLHVPTAGVVASATCLGRVVVFFQPLTDADLGNDDGAPATPRRQGGPL